MLLKRFELLLSTVTRQDPLGIAMLLVHLGCWYCYTGATTTEELRTIELVIFPLGPVGLFPYIVCVVARDNRAR